LKSTTTTKLEDDDDSAPPPPREDDSANICFDQQHCHYLRVTFATGASSSSMPLEKRNTYKYKLRVKVGKVCAKIFILNPLLDSLARAGKRRFLKSYYFI
jgi:hypothetical protein